MNIILTGGSKGIGKEILNLLEKDNKILVLSRTINKEDRPNVKWKKIDLSDKKQIQEIENEIENFKCDILINNAGSGKVCNIEDLDIQEIEEEMMLNLITPMKLTAIVGKNMISKKYGRIINIASISGLNGTPFLFTYSASKAGLINFTQSSSEYYKGKNITVNTICPGGIDTDMSIEGRKRISILKNMKPEEYQESMIDAMGTNGLIKCEDVAKLVKFIINMPSINGQCINICGLIEK